MIVLPHQIKLLRLQGLREHEGTNPLRLRQLCRQILLDGLLRRPIAVDLRTLVVLDGHHRLNVLKHLQCLQVPVCLLDYALPSIEVHSWDGSVITKEEVLRAAFMGQHFPPRTTRHMVRREDGRVVHISRMRRPGNWPLHQLMDPG